MSNSRVRIIKDPEERKQEIIEAALHLFSQKGYEHTTIQDIAKYLNISQGLCYRYFKSKAEIFTATAEFYAQQILIQIRQPFPENMKAIDFINFICDMYEVPENIRSENTLKYAKMFEIEDKSSPHRFSIS